MYKYLFCFEESFEPTKLLKDLWYLSSERKRRDLFLFLRFGPYRFFLRSEYEILSLGFFLFSCFDITRGGGGEGGGRRVGGGGQVGGGGEGKMLKEDIIKVQLDARKFLIEF